MVYRISPSQIDHCLTYLSSKNQFLMYWNVPSYSPSSLINIFPTISIFIWIRIQWSVSQISPFLLPLIFSVDRKMTANCPSPFLRRNLLIAFCVHLKMLAFSGWANLCANKMRRGKCVRRNWFISFPSQIFP